MKIQRKKVKVEWFQYRAICEECGGELVCDGENENIAYTTNPPKYMHVCNNCGKEELIDEHQFPFVNSEVVNKQEVEVKVKVEETNSKINIEITCNHCGHKFITAKDEKIHIVKCPVCGKDTTTWRE